MAGNAEQLRAGVVRPSNAGEPGGAAFDDVRYNGDRFHIVDRGWTAIEADVRRERGLEPGLTLLAFQAFEQRSLFAADIGTCPVMNIKLERETVDIVFADQPCFVGLIHGRLQSLALAHELAANIDVGNPRI